MRSPTVPGQRSLDRYLFEINAFPLIDREEEARLARAIRDGDDEALHCLVRANLRFVVAIAKRYQGLGLPLADLINEGNVGLLKAAARFDESRGIKFISYAVWWIRQAILRALADQGRVVRIPINRSGTVFRMSRRGAVLTQELGREPTFAELASDLGLGAGELEAHYALFRTPLSLDAPSAGAEEGGWAERLYDPEADLPDVAMGADVLRGHVDRALGTLQPREAKVLRLYFGMDGQAPLTLEEIGRAFGLTRERVRQIKERALSRLRHASRVRLLRAHLDS